MEPLSALALAGNIVQFIGFGCSLISESHDIYRHGMSARYVDLENISENLSKFAESIGDDVAPAFQQMAYSGEDGLRQVATGCKMVADELLEILQNLKAKNNAHRKWTSFRQALMILWKQDKIDKLKRRLDEYRIQLNLHLVSIVACKEFTMTSMLRELPDQNSRMDSDMRAKIDDLILSLKPLRKENLQISTNIDIEYCKEMISWHDSASIRISREQSILRSLCFDYMTVRKSRIVEAHTKTFDWIFKAYLLPFADPRSQIKFVDWLHSSEGIYWVSGKPGSGKSTLMKYLAESVETERALRRWAQDSTLLTASFYFWNAGTEMQKSNQGLLQSILFEVLNQCPDMIPSICPDFWEKSGQERISGSLWTLKSLYSSFELLTGQVSMGKKYCFFIDGLDEYEGDHFDLIETLRTLVRSPNIKICVSSRPWNCYEDAFGKDIERKLYLQDLTREDIYLYVKSKLRVHVIPGGNDLHYQHLVSEIVNRAQGVFLWVFLVVKSLREGLANEDTIAILEARLRKLPTELEPFFKHIIDSVDPVYQKQMALTFQVALLVDEPLLLIMHSFLEEENPQYAIRLPPHTFDDEMVKIRKSVMRRRLVGRYRGLLEASRLHGEGSGSLDERVHFLHRTVRDFLMTKDIQTLLNSLLEDGLNPSFAMVRARLAHFKTIPNCQGIPGLLRMIIKFSRQGELETGAPDFEALDEFDVCDQKIFRRKFFPGAQSSFLEALTREGFVSYIEHRIKAKPSIVREYPLLVAAVDGCLLHQHLPPTNMIEMLVRHGMRPNATNSQPIWGKLTEHYPYTSKKHQHERWRRVLKILLSHGLDVHSGTSWADAPSGTSWADLLNRTIGHIKKDNHIEERAAYEIKTSLDLLLAHGANPNQSNEGWRLILSYEGSPMTLWQEFLRSAVSHADLFPKTANVFFLEVIGSFLRYGADPLCRIMPESRSMGVDEGKEMTVPEVIREISRQLSKTNLNWNVKIETLEAELLNLLQSEAHRATYIQQSDRLEGHDVSLVQTYPSCDVREIDDGDTVLEAGDIGKIGQNLIYERFGGQSSGTTRVLGNSRVSKHSEGPRQRANTDAIVRSKHEYIVESLAWGLSEGWIGSCGNGG